MPAGCQEDSGCSVKWATHYFEVTRRQAATTITDVGSSSSQVLEHTAPSQVFQVVQHLLLELILHKKSVREANLSVE